MRDFSRTAEPRGEDAPEAAGDRFVIQKHAARRLHYDLRLELDGVLLSWSVPKGPSLSPAARRLAVRTEDHPLDYAGFEGIIPAGQYGGGTVVVWDRGHWTPVGGDVHDMLNQGRLTFMLEGEKLRGRWHLIRIRRDGTHETWLLFKGRDADADDEVDILEDRPESVLTGRTVEAIAAEPDRVWPSPPAAPTVEDKRTSRIAAAGRRRARRKRERTLDATQAVRPTPAANQNAPRALVDQLPLVSMTCATGATPRSSHRIPRAHAPEPRSRSRSPGKSSRTASTRPRSRRKRFPAGSRSLRRPRGAASMT